MTRQLEVRAIHEGYDEDGYLRTRFEPNVRVVRGVFECCKCGAKQADYALSGPDRFVTATDCEHCGNNESLYLLQLWGTIDNGPEIDLIPVYERDVAPLLEISAALPPASEEG